MKYISRRSLYALAFISVMIAGAFGDVEFWPDTLVLDSAMYWASPFEVQGGDTAFAVTFHNTGIDTAMIIDVIIETPSLWMYTWPEFCEASLSCIEDSGRVHTSEDFYLTDFTDWPVGPGDSIGIQYVQVTNVPLFSAVGFVCPIITYTPLDAQVGFVFSTQDTLWLTLLGYSMGMRDQFPCPSAANPVKQLQFSEIDAKYHRIYDITGRIIHQGKAMPELNRNAIYIIENVAAEGNYLTRIVAPR